MTRSKGVQSLYGAILGAKTRPYRQAEVVKAKRCQRWEHEYLAYYEDHRGEIDLLVAPQMAEPTP
jgi:hypothetical protein